MTVKSAVDPDSLRGEGLDFAVLDECASPEDFAGKRALVASGQIKLRKIDRHAKLAAVISKRLRTAA